ncbi:Uu.00g087910.m01.CDS01 [Anthostomella pinea]|uniref:Uu.00g087910.m01.CDS01 n=1 Tax=Anthostomella pinea TaxID=933095 RepID=A0AAI8YK11_9PEZI|nr:Uu.00g087910.m01.CDS01 [Anthostomella pinea]
MSASPTFPYFPHLPTELQIQVWEIAIAHANRNRFVLVDAGCKQIMPTRFLWSPFLSVTILSRNTYKRLYPVEFRVKCRKYYEQRDYARTFDKQQQAPNKTYDCGTLYISFRLATFLPYGFKPAGQRIIKPNDFRHRVNQVAALGRNHVFSHPTRRMNGSRRKWEKSTGPEFPLDKFPTINVYTSMSLSYKLLRELVPRSGSDFLKKWLKMSPSRIRRVEKLNGVWQQRNY